MSNTVTISPLNTRRNPLILTGDVTEVSNREFFALKTLSPACPQDDISTCEWLFRSSIRVPEIKGAGEILLLKVLAGALTERDDFNRVGDPLVEEDTEESSTLED